MGVIGERIQLVNLMNTAFRQSAVSMKIIVSGPELAPVTSKMSQCETDGPVLDIYQHLNKECRYCKKNYFLLKIKPFEIIALS